MPFSAATYFSHDFMLRIGKDVVGSTRQENSSFAN